jgi:hypothetical protein
MRLLILTLGVVVSLIGVTPSAYAAPPGNDDFGSATTIAALPFSDATSTVDATTQAGDPVDCIDADHSVWYSYTSDFDGFVAVDTYGSDYDTVLSAYTGTQGSLTEIACNDDSGGTLQSHIKWAVTSGTTYHVMVSGFYGSSGSLVLNARAEPPFTFEVTVAGRGSVDETSGVATLRGTVVCSLPGQVFTQDGRLRQRIDTTKVRAYPDGGFSCGPNPSNWEVQATPVNGLFVRGRARLLGMVWHAYTSDFSEDQLQTDDPITIRLRR